MADEKTIDEIKSSIAVSRKRPMNFALCYGKRPDGTLLVFHRKKAPGILARQAKKEGETNKVAFGTVETKGKVLRMTLEEDPPAGLLRQGKLFFSAIGLGLKLKLMSADGTVLEADDDIEEGDEVAEDDDLREDLAAEDDPSNESVEPQDPMAEQRWRAAFERIDPLVGNAEAAAHPNSEQILTAWSAAQDRATGGDFDAALGITAKLLPLLKQGATTTPDGKTPDPIAEKWEKLKAGIEPRLLEALKENHPNGNKMRVIWAFAQEKGEAGDHTTAIKAIQQLLPLLKEPTSAPQDTPPENVVPFQRSRILWLDTKRAMRADLDSLRSAVVNQSADEEEHSFIVTSIDSLVAEFEGIDTALEDILDEITQTPEGQARAALKRRALQAINTYLSVLDRPFFKIVDNNPFTSVNVAARGRQSLGAIQATLS